MLYAASILSNALQWGIVPTTEAEIGLSPAYSCFLALVAKNTLPLFVVYRPHEAGVLGHLIKQDIRNPAMQNCDVMQGRI